MRKSFPGGRHNANTYDLDDTESVIISGSMPTSDIIAQLNLHGCPDITRQLNPLKFSRSAVSTGGFGDVYRGALMDGTRVGVKCLRLLIDIDDSGGRKQLKRAARELYVWSKCKHPNILELIGVAQYDERVAMVSPWMENGNLNWYLNRHPEADRYDLCVQIAEAVAFLKESGVVHGDIKGTNVLVSRDHIPKLADFGTSAMNDYTLKFTTTTASPHMTLRWTAPEIFLGETKHTFEGDVYALGMTILEVFTGSVPFKGLLDVAVMRNLMEKTHPLRPIQDLPVGDTSSDQLWTVLESCWESLPHRRPSSQQVRDELKSINEGRAGLNTVTSDMSPRKILRRLVAHGCRDVTAEIGRRTAIRGYWERLNLTNTDHLKGERELRDGTKVILHEERAITLRNNRYSILDAAYEAYMLSQCQHRHIEGIIGVALVDNSLLTVSPKPVPGHQRLLSDLLASSSRKGKSLPICNMSVQISDAVAFLHSKDLIHGSLHPGNVSVSLDYTIQIRNCNHAIARNPSLRFPERQESPESQSQGSSSKLTFETDVYALGMIIMSIVVRRPNEPLRKMQQRQEYIDLVNSQQGAQLLLLLDECCDEVPEDRPLAIDVRNEMLNFTDEGLQPR